MLASPPDPLSGQAREGEARGRRVKPYNEKRAPVWMLVPLARITLRRRTGPVGHDGATITGSARVNETLSITIIALFQ